MQTDRTYEAQHSLSEQEAIDQQQALLATHRHTLSAYLRQRDALGYQLTPPGVYQGIHLRTVVARYRHH